MLYLSRRIGLSKLGVVDSDDGIETAITESELVQIDAKYGIEIAGVDFNCAPVSMIPWQNPSEMSRAQQKASMLFGVDISVYNRAITSITWRPTDDKKPSVIRLSNFGNRCEDCILYNNEPSRRHRITLVVDDKIKSVAPHTFRREHDFLEYGEGYMGLYIDLRECTNKKLVSEIYSQLFSPFEQLGCFVLDREDRLNAMNDKRMKWIISQRRL